MAEDLAVVRRAVSAVCGSEHGTWDEEEQEEQDTTKESGRRGSPSRPASPSAVSAAAAAGGGGGGGGGGAAKKSLPVEVLTAAEELAVLFSWLANELDARIGVVGDVAGAASSVDGDDVSSSHSLLSSEKARRRESRGGIWALADDMRESNTVLTRAAAADWGDDGGDVDDVFDKNNNNRSISTSGNDASSASTNTSSPVSSYSSSHASILAFSCFRWGGYVTRSVTSRGALSLPFDELVKEVQGWSSRELSQCGLGAYAYAFTRIARGALVTKGGVAEGEAAGRKGGETNTFSSGGDDGATNDSTRTLLQLAKATERCRRYGSGSGVWVPASGPRDEEATTMTTSHHDLDRVTAAKRNVARQLGDIRAHYIAVEAALREANGATNCLHTRDVVVITDPSTTKSTAETPATARTLAPELDPETESPHGSRLATGTALLSYLVGAIEDTLATAGGCAKARDATVGVYYPVPAYDRVAQEMAQCGLDAMVGSKLRGTPDKRRGWQGGGGGVGDGMEFG